MKIILENEMERQAWPILLSAHHKWEKNNGDSIRGQMQWYFFDLYKDETDKMIAREVEARLIDDYGPDGLDVIGVSEAMYVAIGLHNNQEWLKDSTAEEVENFKAELVEEYRDIVEDYEVDKERKSEKVREELEDFYYRLFNAPENLTVEYNGKNIDDK